MDVVADRTRPPLDWLNPTDSIRLAQTIGAGFLSSTKRQTGHQQDLGAVDSRRS